MSIRKTHLKIKTLLLSHVFIFYLIPLFAQKKIPENRDISPSVRSEYLFSFNPIYTLPLVINSFNGSKDPAIKLRGRLGWGFGGGLKYHLNKSYSIQSGINFSWNHVALVQKDFFDYVMVNGLLQKHKNASIIDGKIVLKFNANAIDIPLILVCNTNGKLKTVFNNFIAGASLDYISTSSYGYESSFKSQNSSDTMSVFVNDLTYRAFVPNLILGIGLFNSNSNAKYRFNLVYKNALTTYNRIQLENKVNETIYGAKVFPLLNSILFNFTYTFFRRNAKSPAALPNKGIIEAQIESLPGKKSSERTKTKIDSTIFSIDGSALYFLGLDSVESNRKTGYSSAMFYQVYFGLHKDLFDIGIGAHLKNVLPESIDNTYIILNKKSFFGPAFFIRKNFQLKRGNNFSLQYNFLFSFIKFRDNPQNTDCFSGNPPVPVACDIKTYISPDDKSLVSFGFSQPIEGKIRIGEFIGMGFSFGSFQSRYTPALIGGIYINY